MSSNGAASARSRPSPVASCARGAANDKPLAQMYPEFCELRDLVDRAVALDGEVVALDEQGRPDFGLLEDRSGRVR